MMTSNEPKTDSHEYSELANCDTNNATRIGWYDWECNDYWPADYFIENKKKYYCHLDRHNSGLQNGPNWQNKSYKTYELNRDLILCLGGPLRMGDWEKKRAISLFDALQRSNMGLSSEVVAFCTCAYVVHQYDDNREYHPQTKQENCDPFFEEVREDYDITSERFESVYGKVAHRIRNGDLDIPQHDRHQADSNSRQSWRSTSEKNSGWL